MPLDPRRRGKRQRGDASLAGGDARWRAIFDNSPVMYFVVDAAGQILLVNTFGAEQLGYAADELVGTSVLGVFHEADRQAVREHTARCFDRPGQSMTWELRKVRKDGRIIWVRETARAIATPEAPPVVLVTCEDITVAKSAQEELARAEEELRTSERRHRHIFEAAGVSISQQDFSQVKQAFDALRARGGEDIRAFLEANPAFLREAMASSASST